MISVEVKLGTNWSLVLGDTYAFLTNGASVLYSPLKESRCLPVILYRKPNLAP